MFRRLPLPALSLLLPLLLLSLYPALVSASYTCYQVNPAPGCAQATCPLAQDCTACYISAWGNAVPTCKTPSSGSSSLSPGAVAALTLCIPFFIFLVCVCAAFLGIGCCRHTKQHRWLRERHSRLALRYPLLGLLLLRRGGALPPGRAGAKLQMAMRAAGMGTGAMAGQQAVYPQPPVVYYAGPGQQPMYMQQQQPAQYNGQQQPVYLTQQQMQALPSQPMLYAAPGPQQAMYGMQPQPQQPYSLSQQRTQPQSQPLSPSQQQQTAYGPPQAMQAMQMQAMYPQQGSGGAQQPVVYLQYPQQPPYTQPSDVTPPPYNPSNEMPAQLPTAMQASWPQVQKTGGTPI